MTNYLSNSNSFLSSKSISKGTSNKFLSTKNNKHVYHSSKLDTICLPSPKLNKRYRFSILPTVKMFKFNIFISFLIYYIMYIIELNIIKLLLNIEWRVEQQNRFGNTYIGWYTQTFKCNLFRSTTVIIIC